MNIIVIPLQCLLFPVIKIFIPNIIYIQYTKRILNLFYVLKRQKYIYIYIYIYIFLQIYVYNCIQLNARFWPIVEMSGDSADTDVMYL